MSWLFDMDRAILFYINDHFHNSITDEIFPVITNLGTLGIIWVLSIIALLCMKKTRRTGVLMLIAFAAAACFADLLLKPLIARTRPFTEFPDVRLLIPPESSKSFPSGHSITSFACAAVFFHFDRHWGIGALILASAIAFSRVFLFVHYPTDVLGGMMMGLFIGFLVCAINARVKLAPAGKSRQR